MFITLLNRVFLLGWESAYFLKGLLTGVHQFSFIVAFSYIENPNFQKKEANIIYIVWLPDLQFPSSTCLLQKKTIQTRHKTHVMSSRIRGIR